MRLIFVLDVCELASELKELTVISALRASYSHVLRGGVERWDEGIGNMGKGIRE